MIFRQYRRVVRQGQREVLDAIPTGRAKADFGGGHAERIKDNFARNAIHLLTRKKNGLLPSYVAGGNIFLLDSARRMPDAPRRRRSPALADPMPRFPMQLDAANAVMGKRGRQSCSRARQIPDAESDRARTRLILRCWYSLGDIVLPTAAVRDLHRAHPGQFLTDIRTPFDDLWLHNPWLTPMGDDEVKRLSATTR